MATNHLTDIKYALRLLFKAPRFTALTLFVLTGGLSISLFTFSFLYTFIYKDIPLPEGETAKRVMVAESSDLWDVPAYEFLAVRDQLQSFAEVGVYVDTSVRYSKAGEGKNLPASYVEPGLFAFSRTKPIMGRVLEADDLKPDAEPVAVISHKIWQNELLGADPIGQTLRLNNRLTTVIGVMPAGYQFPGFSELWLPMPESRTRVAPQDDRDINVYGRVKPGISIEHAEAELEQLVNPLYRENAALYDKPEFEIRFKLLSFPIAQTDGGGTIVFLAFNLIAFFILLLACINVGNLLLARAIERQRETAIRAALGAPTARIVSQLMWEGILITLTGGLLSLLLTGAALDYADLAMRSNLVLAFWWRWGLDMPTVLMAGAFVGVTLLLASFLPAWRAARQDINATLRDGTGGDQGLKAGRLSRLLITAQVFLISTLMLVGSMVAFVSNHLATMDIGENREQVIRADIYLPVDKYPGTPERIAFFDELIHRMKNNDNVVDAMVRQYRGKSKLAIEGVAYSHEDQQPEVDTITVMGSTEFYGIEVLDGRSLGRQDHADARRTALVSQSFARRHWPGQSALERRVQISLGGETAWVNVVGVTSNRMNASSMFSGNHVEDEIYVSGYQFHGPYQDIFYKYTGDDKVAEQRFFDAYYSLDPGLEMPTVERAEQNIEVMRKMMNTASNVTFAAGGFALLLALMGIYGLTANAVSRRTHEIGIRRAVGASDQRIMRLFMRQGVRQLGFGLGSALLFFGLLSWLFHGFSEGVFPGSLYVWLAVSVTFGLTVVVLAAVYAPTRRAVRMEPSDALRHS